MKIQGAFELFDKGQYKEAFESFAAIYNASENMQERQELMSILRDAYYEPNEAELRGNYEKNAAALKQYPYFWDKQFAGFSELSFLLFPTSDSSYYIYDKQADCFIGEYDGITRHQMRYFFEHLEDALKVEDEDNLYNLTFLFDNVRRSEDVAMDNHIYLFYHSWQPLQRVMQVGDIAPILKDEKFVFLIGENHKRYPIDFKRDFKIDYAKMKPQMLRIEEINRIFVFSSTNGHCGNAMIDSLLDWHPNLLTIKEFGLSAFPSFYENCLKGRSCKDFLSQFLDNQEKLEYRPFFTFFTKIYRGSEAELPNAQKFMQLLLEILKDRSVPTQKEWFCALFYANSLALNKPLNHRIVPAIFHAPHIVWGSNWDEEYGKMQAIYHSFKYIAAFSLLRRPEAMFGGAIKYEMNCRKLYHTPPLDCFSFLFFPTGEMKNIDWRKVYHDQYAFFCYEDVAVIRYEDIKTNPKAALYSLCEHFNIPWSDELLRCTRNGKPTIYNDAGTVISDFDLKPLSADYYGEYLNAFDRFRIEVLYYGFYQYWGYKPRLYQNFHYSDAEIQKMFELPFEFEGSSNTWTFSYVKSRSNHLAKLKEVLNYLHLNQRRVKTGEIVPYKCLVPKLEYRIAPIYE